MIHHHSRARARAHTQNKGIKKKNKFGWNERWFQCERRSSLRCYRVYLYLNWLDSHLRPILASCRSLLWGGKKSPESLLLSSGISLVQVCSCANSALISDANAKVSAQEDVSATFYTWRLRKPWRTRRAELFQGEFGCVRQFTVILLCAKKLHLTKGLPSTAHFAVLLTRDKVEDETVSAPRYLLPRCTQRKG